MFPQTSSSSVRSPSPQPKKDESSEAQGRGLTDVRDSPPKKTPTLRQLGLVNIFENEGDIASVPDSMRFCVRMARLWQGTGMDQNMESIAGACRCSIPEMMGDVTLESIVDRIIPCDIPQPSYGVSSDVITVRSLPRIEAEPGIYVAPFVGNVSRIYLNGLLASRNKTIATLADRLERCPPSILETVLTHPCIFGRWNRKYVSDKLREISSLQIVTMEGMLIRMMNSTPPTILVERESSVATPSETATGSLPTPPFISGLDISTNDRFYVAFKSEEKASDYPSLTIREDGSISVSDRVGKN